MRHPTTAPPVRIANGLAAERSRRASWTLNRCRWGWGERSPWSAGDVVQQAVMGVLGDGVGIDE